MSIDRWMGHENVACVDNELLYSHQKEEMLSFETMQKILEDIVLSRISQTGTDIYFMHHLTRIWNLKK